MEKPNLEQILDVILAWKIEAVSGHNDGMVRQHYISKLAEVRAAASWPAPKKPQPRDPGLAQDEEFGF
jgi:hypothetical protein